MKSQLYYHAEEQAHLVGKHCLRLLCVHEGWIEDAKCGWMLMGK